MSFQKRPRFCSHCNKNVPLFDCGHGKTRAWLCESCVNHEDYRGKQKRPLEPTGNKWKNKFVRIDGKLMDSITEAARYLELRAKEKTGLISELSRQVDIWIRSQRLGRERWVKYIADLTYREPADAKTVTIEDVKGVVTREFEFKAELLFRDGYTVEVVKRQHIERSFLDLATSIQHSQEEGLFSDWDTSTDQPVRSKKSPVNCFKKVANA